MKQQEINKLLDDYRRGTISPENRHLLEQLSIEDDFVFDAMEGMNVEANSPVASKDLDGLRERLEGRVSTQNKVRKITWWLPGAAAAVLLVVAGLWLFQDSGSTNEVYAALPKEANTTQDQEISDEATEYVEQEGKVEDSNNSGAVVAEMEEREFADEEDQEITQQSIDEFLKRKPTVNATEVPAKEAKTAKEAITNQPTVQEPRSTVIEKDYAMEEVATAEVTEDEVAVSNADVVEDSFQGDLNTEYSPERRVEEELGAASAQSAPARAKAKKAAPGDDSSIVYKGRILDNNGYGIIGASISIVGLKRAGFTSDMDGNVVITGVDMKNPRAIISYTGFNTVEVPLYDGFEVTLQEGALLSEVVVVSAGKDSKTGNAVPVVGWDEFNETLANRVNRTSGSASAGIEIRFRVSQNGVPRGFMIVKGKDKPEAQAVIDLIKAEEWTPGRGKVIFN